MPKLWDDDHIVHFMLHENLWRSRFYDGLSIDEPSLSARVTSIQPASLRSSERCALPYSHGRKRLAEWPQYQVQPGPMQPVSSAIWPASNSSIIAMAVAECPSATAAEMTRCSFRASPPAKNRA